MKSILFTAVLVLFAANTAMAGSAPTHFQCQKKFPHDHKKFTACIQGK